MNSEDQTKHSMREFWKKSRSGAWAGRGFHYQYLFSTLILIRQWAGLTPSGFLVPEGLEDCVLEFTNKSVFLQIKSRLYGSFTKTEVLDILNNVNDKILKIKGNQQIQAAVILEQPCSGVNEVGIDQLLTERSASVYVCKSPVDESINLLSAQLEVAEVVSEGIVSDLYMLIADASQNNASLPFEKRRRISTTEVECRIYERLQAEDHSAIDSALASGALEPIDFNTPVNEPAFYQGVKVISGHVAAGLVLDRPDDTKSIISVLRRRRRVLLSGPSGAGKSALMWLSANALSGEFRWYQITARAVAASADAIIRFVRARRPTETSPIGLAFDEVGSASNDLWDILVQEFRGIPSVYLLGSMRQEDIALVANQADTEFVAVSLDEKLADKVWQKLNASGQTNWDHWREPFEQSEGLMLEYIHLLTQGQRLAAVITDQVRQREREGRNDELAIIRCTAVLCSLGGEVQASTLIELLNLKPDDASYALKRLIDEHLVRESRPGVLGGLHMLRSEALREAGHDETVYLSMDSLWRSLSATTNETLHRVVQSIFSDISERDEKTVIRKLAETLEASSDLGTWIGILTGLGLATLDRLVMSFIDILDKHEVQRAHWAFASMYSDPQLEIPKLSESEQWQRLCDAVQVFRELPKQDLRQLCLEELSEGSSMPPCSNLLQANKILSCLVPICGGEPLVPTIIPNLVGSGEQDIQQVAALLSTAYLVGRDEAEKLVQALGGEQILFDWFRSQTPWVTTPVVEVQGKHGRTVHSDFFYIDQEGQSDAHEIVCGICETLIAISPASDAAASDAVNPQGDPLSVGEFLSWSKNIPRQNLPPKARIAWNVAFRQILLAKSVSESLTEYTRRMAELVKRTEKVFRSITEKWIKGKNIPNVEAVSTEIHGIVSEVDALAYAVPEKPAFEMTTPAEGAGKDDPLGALLIGILKNLVERVIKVPSQERAKAVAVYAGELASQAQERAQSEIWRTMSEPPLREISAMSERLKCLSDILHEMACDDGQASLQGIIKAARKSSRGKAIRTAARHCRRLAEQRLKRKLKALESGLGEKGWKVQCWSRPVLEGDSVYWPAMEIAILVEIEDFETDAHFIEDSLALGRQYLVDEWRFRVVPVIDSYVLAPLALLPTSHIALPDLNFFDEWQMHIDLPFLSSELAVMFDRALDACSQLSAIITCRNLDNLHVKEAETFSQAIESFEHYRDLLAATVEETSLEILAWAHDYLNQTWDRVVSEYEEVKAGQDVVEPLCMNKHQALAGQLNEQSVEVAGARILIMQAECARIASSAGDQAS